MKYKFLTIILFISICASLKTEAQSQFTETLNKILATENLETRISLADELNEKMATAVEALPNADSIDVSSRVSQLFSSDKKVGIYTWCVKTQRGMYKYYGILKSPNGVQTLQDVCDMSDTATDVVLADGKWHGAVYFKMIEIEHKGKTLYTLLGNDLSGLLSSKKIIEVLSFDDKKPIFGAQIFEKAQRRRLIFEYNKRATVYMKYHSELKMIIINYLIPINLNFLHNYKFYVPDISYDGYKFEHGFWHKYEDVNIERLD